MSKDLDAIAYRNKIEYRLRRLEETILLLGTVTRKTFFDKNLQDIYDKHVSELRAELYEEK